MLKFLAVAVLALGAALVAWMGSAFVGGNPLALVVTLAIGLCYLVGAAELVRFHRDTGGLRAALDGTAGDLASWLAALPDSLRNPVRRRVQGGQGALPMPVLTPYLTGLLVMLGMLGTFVGMVATLQGAVAALEGTTELTAIRDGLAAPIKGLGMAFGTSVAGVAASAALGFVATLCRRERLAVGRQLDAVIDSQFHHQSLPGFREQVLVSLQEQSRVLPDLVAALAAQGNRLASFAGELYTRLVAGQDRFHQQMLTIHRELAESVGQSLRESLADSGRLAGESIRPVVAESMAAVAAAAADTQRAVRDGVAHQVDTLTAQLALTTADIGEQWRAGIDQQRRDHLTLLERIGGETERLSRQVDGTLSPLLDGFARLQGAQAEAQARDQVLQDERRRALVAIDALVAGLQRQGEDQRTALAGQADNLVETVAGLASQLAGQAAEQQDRLAALHDQLHRQLAEGYGQLGDRLVDGLRTAAQDQGRQAAALMEPLMRDTLAAVVHQADTTQRALTASAASQHQSLADNLRQLTALLTERWTDALDSQRQANGRFLGETAQAVDAIRQQFSASGEQWQAAVAGLQQGAAASLARETDLHARQQALAAELAALVSAIAGGAARQRAAVEDLTATAAHLLADAGAHLERKVEAETGKLAEAADHFAAGALELASLGDALLQVAGGFAAANERLLAAAGQLESAIAAAAERSDEQMGYYVAQAREVIDHSVLAQQQLIEQMRQLARPS